MEKEMKKLLMFVVLVTSMCPLVGAAAQPKKPGYDMGTVVNPKCLHPDCKHKPAFYSLGDYDDHKQRTGHGVDVTAGRPKRGTKPSAAVQRVLAHQALVEQNRQDALKAAKSKSGKMRPKRRTKKARSNPMGTKVASPPAPIQLESDGEEGLWKKIQGWGEDVVDEVAREMDEAWHNFEGLFTSKAPGVATSGTPSPFNDSGQGLSQKPSPIPSPVQQPGVHVAPMEEDDAWMNALILDGEVVEEEDLHALPGFEAQYDPELHLDAAMQRILQGDVVDDFDPMAAVNEEELFISDVDVDDINLDGIDLDNFEGLRLPE
jgi:hypothetical protein